MTTSLQVRRIASHLANSSEVKSLFIGSAGLGDAGTELLSAAVGVCPSLTQLYMGHNGIGPKGAAKLAAALSYNTTLELLNLTNNHLVVGQTVVCALRECSHPVLPPPLSSSTCGLPAIELALLARQAHAWSRSVPEDIFLNNVLPYANMDEPRDDWRSLFSALFAPIVAGAGSLTGAAQLLNERIWSIWGIEFQPDHTPEIMSPSQTISAGFASCTGLSIFLVDACRAVGIPARVAGTPDWQEVRNGDSPKERFHNHNWAEIWDGEHWSFTGAAEYNPAGFNRTWFFPHPAKGQIPGDTLQAIYAVSFKPSDTYFPLIWRDTPEAKHNRVVHAEDVTRNYLTAVHPDAA
ncbi:MAG: hypothetical protein WDW38_003759 [Sanguina aurantia]